jgi:hypothetical protein
MANETIIRAIENAQKRTDVPRFRGGDTVRVHAKVVEGGKERIQSFRGDVIKQQGTGATASFTVRKISDGVGVERLDHDPQQAGRDEPEQGDRDEDLDEGEGGRAGRVALHDKRGWG